MKYLIVLVAASFAFACSNSKTSDAEKDVDSLRVEVLNPDEADSVDNFDYAALESYAYTEDVDASLVEVIDSDCALLIYPTDQQIEDMKKEYGEDDFYTVADDASFYQYTATRNLDSVGVKRVGVKKRYVKFNGTGGSWSLDLRKKGAPEWNIVLFRHDKKPKIISSIDLTFDSVRVYFNK